MGKSTSTNQLQQNKRACRGECIFGEMVLIFRRHMEAESGTQYHDRNSIELQRHWKAIRLQRSRTLVSACITAHHICDCSTIRILCSFHKNPESENYFSKGTNFLPGHFHIFRSISFSLHVAMCIFYLLWPRAGYMVGISELQHRYREPHPKAYSQMQRKTPWNSSVAVQIVQ